MIIACPECTRPFELRDDHIAALIQIACPSCRYHMILDFAAANDPALIESGMRMASGFRTAADFRAWSGGPAEGAAARTSPATPPATVRTIAPRPTLPGPSDDATTMSVPRVVEPMAGEPIDELDDPSIQVRPRSAGTAAPPIREGVRERTVTPREVAYTPREPRTDARTDVSETMTTRPAPGRAPVADDVYDEDDAPVVPTAAARGPLHIQLDASMEEDDAPTQIHAPGSRPYEVARGSDVIVRRPVPDQRPQVPPDGYEYGEAGTGAPESLYTTEPAGSQAGHQPGQYGGGAPMAAPPMAELAPEPARRTVTMTPAVERMPPHTPPLQTGGPAPRVDAGTPAMVGGPAPGMPAPAAERGPRARGPRFENFDSPDTSGVAPKRSVGGTIVVLLLLLLSLGLVGASLALENTPDPRPLLEKAYRKYIKGE